VHGGFGYLIHQFLDSSSNQRTDSYGGSAANRARFALEALEAVVDVFGPKRVAIKLLPSGGGNDVGCGHISTFSIKRYLFDC
jgi:2,4-dienoyl-CoA reductase-like NADH-dependent reductase (Old Yellow Enzyme family)